MVTPQSCKDASTYFCKASTARFNTSKTKIIPLGSAEDRGNLIQSRDLNGWIIPGDVRTARDGEATRILGSWQGNGIMIQNKWNNILKSK